MKRFFSSNLKPPDQKAEPKPQEKAPTAEPSVDESERTVAIGNMPPRLLGHLDNAKEAPTRFGRYEVRQSLGTGGYGDVYLGHDGQLDRPVAIKVLRRKPDQKQAEDERSLREARKLARLRHPGIVT